MRAKISLRTTLTFNFLIVVTLPIIVISIVTLQILGVKLKEQITAQNMWLARALAGEIEEFLTSPENNLNIMNEYLESREELGDRQIDQYLDAVIHNFPYFDMIQVLDGRGSVKYLSPYKQDFYGINLSNQELFRKTIQSQQTCWSQSFISIQTGRPTLAVARPFRDGIIVGYLNCGKISRIIERVYPNDLGWVEILDRKGAYIFHSNTALVNQRINMKNRYPAQQGLAGKPGFYRYRDHGKVVLSSVAVVSQTGWPVMICQYEAEAFAPVRVVRDIFLAGALGALFMAYLIAAGSLGQILTPFSRLAKRASQVAAGNYEIGFEHNDFLEFEELAHDFSLMIEAIRSRERDLRESEERYALAMEGANDGLWDWNLKKHRFYISPRGRELLSIGADTETIRWRSLVHPEDFGRFQQELRLYFQGSSCNFHHEYRFLHCDGSWRWLLIRGITLRDADGRINRMAGSATDVTARKESETQIQASLKEKEVLLKEIHHRVKNNMQVISSLLRLQCGYLSDRHTIELFEESQNRIKSMALVHEKLYQSKDLAKIDFRDYVIQLANILVRSYGVNAGRVALQITIDNIRLGIDTAIPCGLIINELLSNSLKYAFPNDRTGIITIHVSRLAGDELALTVSDNGIGIPVKLNLETTESLGLQLVRILGEEQLQGRIAWQREPGTEFRLVFQEV
jgi:PAS domain S-box-containing protein